MDYETFLAAVEHDAHASRDVAERAVRATLQTLAERLTGGEADAVAEQLPPELRPFVHDGGTAEPSDVREFKDFGDLIATAVRSRARIRALDARVSAQEFHDRVARRAAIDVSEARRATEAVLEALAYRIASGGRARKVPLEEFLGRVADREGVSEGDTLPHVRAVLSTLHEVAGAEVRDVLSELPADYRALIETGRRG